MNDTTTRTRTQIDEIAMTSDQLTSRAGLAVFVRYLSAVGVGDRLHGLFSRLRKSAKGQAVAEVFKQIFVFMADGTSRHLSYFDQLKTDSAHAGVLESEPEQLLSSHSVKRFFKAFSLPLIHRFRQLLMDLFLWRLGVQQPDVIILGIDSMVMDNDTAPKRHGVRPTYKKVKGFHPLQLVWGRFIIDARFRRGDRNSNYGQDASQMISRAVEQIRSHYRADVPIVVRMDSGFFDQALFRTFEALGIGYVCAGRLYGDIRERAAAQTQWSRFHNGHQMWRYFELSDQRAAWGRARRAVYSQPINEDQQLLLEFARPDLVIYTNLGQGEAIDELLSSVGKGEMTRASSIISFYHGRGSDELVHRSQKEFVNEKLPFKRFGPNMAYYYTSLVAFFLLEAFKEDVCAPVIPVEAYPTTVRRRLFDQAGKLVRHAGRIVLKVTRFVWEHLCFDRLWRRAACAPAIRPNLAVGTAS